MTGSTLLVNIGDLSINGNANFRLGTTIAANQTTDIVNTARVFGFEIETELTNNQDSAVVDLTEADLIITKTDNSDPINAGTQLVYRITVTNNGPDAALDVRTTDNLPDDVTFVSGAFVTGTGTVNETTAGSGDLLIAMGDLANGESAAVDITVNVAANATSPLSNVASVVSNPNNDPNPANNTTTEPTEVQRVVDVAVDKSVAQPTVVAGETASYTVMVSNNGPGEARTVSVTDTLDPRLSFVPASFDGGTAGVTVTQNGQRLTFDVGTLAVDAVATFTFDVVALSSATGVIPNAVTITTSDIDNVVTNNDDTVNVTVENQIDLILEKDVDRSTAIPGEHDLVYSFVVRHDSDSPSDARNVVFSDILPAGLTAPLISAPTATFTDFNAATRRGSSLRLDSRWGNSHVHDYG